LEEYLLEIMEKLRLNFYKKIFTNVRERDGSLSAMEVFSLEVIHALGEPTISEFARFTGISQSNATYKVQCLMKKGYIKKHPAKSDRREYILKFTDKYYAYIDLFEQGVRLTAKTLADRLPKTEYKALEGVLKDIDAELTERLKDPPQQE
jgi:DNA-binding MarR family transcriptional regulator